MKKFLSAFFIIFSLCVSVKAQTTGEVRGFVYDKKNGEPIIFTNVFIKELAVGKTTDINGFYAISKLKPGSYLLQCYSIGYDTASVNIVIESGKIITHNLYLNPVEIVIDEVKISADRQKAISEVKISANTITQKELKALPSFGGEPDLVQYLQVLPGVVFSGDQGGQLYIRGGSPVQNKVLLDGMTIYNPFHSIGLFSVFDADIIRSADVYAGGFNAQYGGRIGAIIDVNTREGNKARFGGKLAVNPITSKVLLEGPISKFSEGGSSSSFIVSYKTSYLDQTSKTLYNYADKNGLPYSFNDLYGKLSYNSSNGSKINVFGFNFSDHANFVQTKYNWNSYGIGTNFLVIPEGATIINGVVAYSNYEMQQVEQDNQPRNSSINGFNVALNFTYYLGKDDIKYGLEMNGFSTKFNYVNNNGRLLNQDEYTTELAGFFKYKKTLGRFIVEPGIRIQGYASLGEYSFEPRIGAKWNAKSWLRFKAAGGFYTQNLLSAVSDQDVVNLFYGFLSGPDNTPETFDGKTINSRLQKAWHTGAGVEVDLGKYSEINIEGFFKNFSQLTNINRDKIYDDVPEFQDKPERQRADYIIETGYSYGMDFRYKYEYKRFYFWLVYSLTFVDRFDGTRNYFPHFDRRHNLNIVTTYNFGKEGSWSANARWNLGSGFPFTQTQGFYPQLNLNGGISGDVLTQNGQLGIYYTDINTGRLPTFHRLDLSLSKKIKFSERVQMTVTAAATNVYNRSNIFYFDRVRYQRVNQLPIMPTLGINLSF